MARRRAKRAQVVDQSELDFTSPPTPRKPTRTPADTEQAAHLAIARRVQPAGAGDKVRLTLMTIFLSRKKAERLAARAIGEAKNLEAVVAEILEAAD
jgi:hypothetical protein